METETNRGRDTAKGEDRRVQKTRRLLQEALISLIQEKDYDDITVQDLIDRANVGRSTFYSHFLDKDDLLISRLEEMRVSFEEQHRKLVEDGNFHEQRTHLSLAFFQHAQEHHMLYKAVVGKRSGSMITRRLYEYLADLFRQHLISTQIDNIPENIPQELLVQFLASSLMALLTWWFDNDLPYSPEQMNTWYHRLALQFLGHNW